MREEDIISSLRDIGLNKNEASVYLAIIKHGPANISVLANKSAVKRPTAYLAIESLIVKKMVIVNRQNPNRPIYKITDPKKVLDAIRFKEKRYAEIFPQLRVMSKQEFAPYVEIYEGLEGLKKVYEEVLNEALNNDVQIYGTINAEKSQVHKIIYKYWMSFLKNNKVHIREILDRTQANINYVNKIKKIRNKYHITKLIPENFQFLPYKMKLMEADNIIYGNKIAFFSSYERNLYVIVITHKNICKIYKDLFEMAWEVAEEY
ncbi:MAG: helix-turn-helix domain-containing protein [Patescibacteria group bacterium]|jgi:sugar-specific transcriptional regulator TrmB